ncbi:MAG: permease-like cell division protein FtsX [Clostridia bacterium]
MRFNVISYLIKEGISNLFKNKKSTISSLMIMCATMLIFGLFFVIGENINAFVENVAEAQEIRVNLKTDATDKEIEEVGNEILSIEGVRNAEYVSKEEAIKYMEDLLGSEAVAEYKERNIFPVAYNVTLTDLNLNDDVQAAINEIPQVDNIVSSNQVIAQIVRLAKGVKYVTAGILVLLVIISVSIIANTIKLTVHARRKEISIMKYVGATNSFIRWPFLVEGVIIGVIAGLLSVGIVGLAYTGIANQLSGTEFLETVHWKLLDFKDMFNLILTVYLVLGMELV